VREFFKIVAPKFIEGGPPKPEGHRALSDIEGDVLLLKFLKKGLNVDVAALAKDTEERDRLIEQLNHEKKDLAGVSEALTLRESYLLGLCVAAGVESDEDLLARVQSLVLIEAASVSSQEGSDDVPSGQAPPMSPQPTEDGAQN